MGTSECSLSLIGWLVVTMVLLYSMAELFYLPIMVTCSLLITCTAAPINTPITDQSY